MLAEGQNITTCCLQSNKGQKVFTVPFVGDHHLQNTIAAISTVSELGFPIEAICDAVEKLYLPKGRLEEVKNDLGLSIYIDYAHTEAALRAVLQTLKKTVKGDLITVFSCGGDRDKHKRKKMGAVASRYANLIYLTMDNPRSEDPEVINEQIASGFTPNQQYEVILDRAKAIETAIRSAKEGDTILIAGKGHEKTQTIGTKQYEFSDFECVRLILEQIAIDSVE